MQKITTLLTVGVLATATVSAGSLLDFKIDPNVRVASVARRESGVKQRPARIMKAKKARHDELYNYRVLMSENFNGMTAGSIENPDRNYIEDGAEDIAPSYTDNAGWSGFRIGQAGGAMLIDTYNGSEHADEGEIFPVGHVFTPVLDISGNDRPESITISMRVRSVEDEGDVMVIGLLEHKRGAFSNDGTSISGGDWIDVEFTVDLPESVYTTVSGSGEEESEGEFTEEEEIMTAGEEIIEGGGEGEIIEGGDNYGMVPLNSICFKITGGRSGIIIDDVEIAVKTPKVDIPEVLPHSNFTADGFTANWSAVEGADKYVLSVNSLKIVDGDYEYTPVVTGKEVTGTSADVTVNTDGVFAYSVHAVAGAQRSPESSEMKVFDIVPPVMKEATDVTTTGFTANWEEVGGATGYDVWAYSSKTMDSDVNGYTLASLVFSGLTSNGEEEESPFDETAYLDDYSFGWVAGPYPGAASGEVGAIVLDNSGAAFGMRPAFMQSPEYDLSHDSGNVIVTVSARSDDNAEIAVGIGGLDENGVFGTISALGVTTNPNWCTYQFELDGGKEGCMIAIQMMSGGKVEIHDVAVSQNMKRGDIVELPYCANYVTGVNSAEMPVADGCDRVKVAACSVKLETLEMMGMTFVIDEAVSKMSEPVYVSTSAGADTVKATSEIVSTEWYNLQGVKIAAPSAGSPAIAIIRYSDGTTTSHKTLSR